MRSIAELRLALADARRTMIFTASEIRAAHEELTRLGVPAHHSGEPLSLSQRCRMAADRWGPKPEPRKPAQPDPEAWREFY